MAAARGVEITSIESRLEGDIDLQGVLGLSGDVRNGFQRIQVEFDVKGNAPEEKLRETVEQSRTRSAVYDVLTDELPLLTRHFCSHSCLLTSALTRNAPCLTA